MPLAIPSRACSFFFDPKLSRAPSDFNIGRTLVLNGTWEVPSPKSFTGPAHWVADGWQLGVIFAASERRAVHAHLGHR